MTDTNLKTTLFLSLLLLSSGCALVDSEMRDEFVDGSFYYNGIGDTKLKLFKSTEAVTVKFAEDVSGQEAKKLSRQYGLTLFHENQVQINSWEEIVGDRYIVMRLPADGNLEDFLTSYPKDAQTTSFGNHPFVRFCLPSFARDRSGDEESRLFMTDRFAAKAEADLSKIKAFSRKYNVEIVSAPDRLGNMLLRITPKSPQNPLQLANLFHESELFTWAHPLFYFKAIGGSCNLQIQPENVKFEQVTVRGND